MKIQIQNSVRNITRREVKSSPDGGSSESIKTLYQTEGLQYHVLVQRRHRAARSGNVKWDLKLFDNFRYIQQEAQEKTHRPENKHFIIPAFQQMLLRQ